MLYSFFTCQNLKKRGEFMRTKSRWIVQMLKGQQQQKRYRRVWLETTTHHLFMKCHNIFFFFLSGSESFPLPTNSKTSTLFRSSFDLVFPHHFFLVNVNDLLRTNIKPRAFLQHTHTHTHTHARTNTKFRTMRGPRRFAKRC